MRKMLVIARGPNETTRRSTEDAFASALNQHGVQSSTAYRAFPDRQPDRQVVRAYLQDQGYDGALVAAFKGVSSQTAIEPGADFDAFYGGFWGAGAYVETDAISSVSTKIVATLAQARLIPPMSVASSYASERVY